MANTPVIRLVGTRCRPENEAEFNKWYDEVHIPLLMKFKGLKAATRYKLVGEAKDAPAYLAVYYFDSQADLDAWLKSPELAAADDEMKRSWPDANSWEVTWRADYQQIKGFER